MKRKHLVRRAGFGGRLWALLIPAALILSADLPVAMTIGYSMAVILVLAAVTHIVRKVLFPYVDLEVMVGKATETPGGSATVFLGVCMVVCALILAGAIWLAD